MKLYLCAIDLDVPGIAFVRFAADEAGARKWRQDEDQYKNAPGYRPRIFVVEAEELFTDEEIFSDFSIHPAV